MEERFTEENYLLQLLSESLKKKDEHTQTILHNETLDWDKFLTVAENHAVLSLLYDRLMEEALSEENRKRTERVSRRVVQQSYHLLFFSRYVIELLQQQGIQVVLLKGPAISCYYPVPELRKSGDVDLLLLDKDKLAQAGKIFKEAGFCVEKKQITNHHLAVETPQGIEIELHTMLAEPFENDEINRYLEQTALEMKYHVQEKDIMGIRLPVLSDAYNAYYLLIHMLQHFLREGFGLKLLCDWVVFWNSNISEEEVQGYQKLIKESRLEGFSRMITSLCIHFLGLKDIGLCSLLPKETSREFMKDILEAEEFGKSNRERMLVLQGTGISDYMREFQHQMHLNYPNAGKIWILWPLLWIATLIRFLYNNRKIRKTSSIKIFRQAEKRSWMLKQLKLFQK